MSNHAKTLLASAFAILLAVTAASLSPAIAQEGVPKDDSVYGPVDPEDPFYELRRRGSPPAQPAIVLPDAREAATPAPSSATDQPGSVATNPQDAGRAVPARPSAVPPSSDARQPVQPLVRGAIPPAQRAGPDEAAAEAPARDEREAAPAIVEAPAAEATAQAPRAAAPEAQSEPSGSTGLGWSALSGLLVLAAGIVAAFAAFRTRRSGKSPNAPQAREDKAAQVPDEPQRVLPGAPPKPAALPQVPAAKGPPAALQDIAPEPGAEQSKSDRPVDSTGRINSTLTVPTPEPVRPRAPKPAHGNASNQPKRYDAFGLPIFHPEATGNSVSDTPNTRLPQPARRKAGDQVTRYDSFGRPITPVGPMHKK